jgi:hypothetical protein
MVLTKERNRVTHTCISRVVNNLSTMPFQEITLNDGRKIPQIGFGSWKIPKDVCAGQVDQAIDIGFDHIDTAQGEWSGQVSALDVLLMINSLLQRGGSRTSSQGIRPCPKRVLAHYEMVRHSRQERSTIVRREFGEARCRVP